jgi:hypothetical protein
VATSLWLKTRGFHEMDNLFKAARLGALVFIALGGCFMDLGKASSLFADLSRQERVKPLLKDVLLVADTTQFATKEEAEAFLSKELPRATAANPKYRGEDGALTQWLSKELTFLPSKNPNGLLVRMSEEVLNFKNGVRVSTGSHEVQFQIEDVAVSLLTDSKDFTEGGEQGQGVIFKCISGKCVTHKWDGVESTSDWTDISIQDLAVRDKIFAAFMTLKRATTGG